VARTPALVLAHAAVAATVRAVQTDWFGSFPHRLALGATRPTGLAAKPRDLRPGDAYRGEQILAGDYVFADQLMRVGKDGDPWGPCPSRAFAAELHAMAWLNDLMATGEAGTDLALRLVIAWRRAFGHWNAFAWAAGPLERRVAALSCALPRLLPLAGEAEGAHLLVSLQRQARHLLAITDNPARRAERMAAAAIAGAALSGKPAQDVLRKALARLERRLPATVLHDGGHATRSPQATLEMLFDLLTLDDALSQRGRAPPVELSRAIDRLSTAGRFFTLAAGRLAQMQGGAGAPAARVAAAQAHDDETRSLPADLRDNGYHRLEGGQLQVLVDAAPPSAGQWSIGASVSPGAVEILAGGRKLIAGTVGRWVEDASIASLDAPPAVQPLEGFAARALGLRLAGRLPPFDISRHPAPEGAVLELTHGLWRPTLGLNALRSLYLDGGYGELRGEDTFFAPFGAQAARRQVTFTARFHLAHDVRASLAADGRTVLLQVGAQPVWYLRNDAAEVSLAPSKSGQQVVLRGAFQAHEAGRLRWKLTHT
jgi:uncharacterized heparinase superfamily protein